MLKYTICFILRDNEILMLNRQSPSWMGMWNGVGGKIEANESAEECIIREIKEETGIITDNVEFKGNVCWEANGKDLGGMYVFIAKFPESYEYPAPRRTDEGILDWKDYSWLMHKENKGVVQNIKYYLPKMLDKQGPFNFMFEYEGMDIADVKEERLTEESLPAGNR